MEQVLDSANFPTPGSEVDQKATNQSDWRKGLVWNPTSNGQFSVKSAYELIVCHNESNSNRTGSSNKGDIRKHMWKRTWRLNVKSKVKHFIWKCCNGVLPIVDKLIQRVMQVDHICKVCDEAPETVEHSLLQCTRVGLLWRISPIRWDCFQQCIHSFSLWWQQLSRLDNQPHNQPSFSGIFGRTGIIGTSIILEKLILKLFRTLMQNGWSTIG